MRWISRLFSGALACVCDMVCVARRSMFLSQRTTQAEYCDRLDLPLSEVANNYRRLARFNRLLLVSDPFQRLHLPLRE